MKKLRYKRILLKISGELFLGNSQFSVDFDLLNNFSEKIKEMSSMGVEIAIVVGGGNIWRGKEAAQKGMDRSTADYAGMLATMINALVLQDVLEKRGVIVRTQTAIPMQSVAEPYILRRAIRHLEKGRVVIFGAGTGNPRMTTDTAAALRAADINANILLMAKNKIDGVYDSDPRKNHSAKKFKKLTYLETINKQLEVMDLTSLTLCMENQIPIIVFDIQKEGNLKKIIEGEEIGTLIN